MADTTVPMEYLENYVSTLHDLDAITRALLQDALANTDLSDRDAVTATMQAICETTSDAATEISRQFYRGLSVMQTGRDMTKKVLARYDPTATKVATSAIWRDADDEAELLEQLSDRVSYELNRASKQGMWDAGQVDGRDVRYARVPVGAETCAWCLMTAGLGFWYMSEEAASHSHRGCDCAIIPSIGRGEVHIKGYDSTVYRDMWREANKLRANGDLPQEMLDHIAGVHALRDREGRAYRDDTNGTLYVMRQLYGLK